MEDNPSKKSDRRAHQLEIITDELITSDDLGFMHTTMAQCFLPRRSIAEKSYQSRHGKAMLLVEAGKVFDGNDMVVMDVPSGAKSRLIMTYIDTYATKHNSVVIDMGDSLNDFLNKMQVPVGGKNFKATMRELNNIASAQMTFGGWEGNEVVTKYARVMSEIKLWRHRDDKQLSLWPSEGYLSPEYVEILRQHRMPLDLRAIKALQSSALDMDIYKFFVYRLPRLKAPTKIKWAVMHQVFGQEYSRMRDFRRIFRKSVKNIHAFYPEARIDVDGDEYFQMYPSRSPIPKNIHVSKGLPPKKPADNEAGQGIEKIGALSIRADTIKKARTLNSKGAYPWDFDVLVEQFTQWNTGKTLDSVDGAFIGFVKKKSGKPH